MRGLTVMLMIVVNNPGSWTGRVYAQLEHASWHGFTLTDMVFPSFLFCVGAAVWFAFRKRGHKLDSASGRKILRRSAAIFVVGLLLNAFPFFCLNDITHSAAMAARGALQALGLAAAVWAAVALSRDGSKWYYALLVAGIALCLIPFAAAGVPFVSLGKLRIMGVLQRIALCYALGSVLCLRLRKPLRIALAAVLLLAVYWGTVLLFGGTDLNGYVGTKIDAAILGVNHLYCGEGVPFDPEGLLGTLAATVNVLLGFLAASAMGRSGKKGIVTLLVAGAALVAVALLSSTVCPINKKIWSPSYALLSSGISMAVWSVLSLLTDRWKLKMPLSTAFGMNALFIYCFAWVLGTELRLPVYSINVYSAWYDVLAGFMAPEAASLCSSLTLVAVCAIAAVALRRRNIYVKL